MRGTVPAYCMIVMASPATNPARAEMKTILRKRLMTAASMAGKRKRVAHVVSGVVHRADVRKARKADDEQAEERRQTQLGQARSRGGSGGKRRGCWIGIH